MSNSPKHHEPHNGIHPNGHENKGTKEIPKSRMSRILLLDDESALVDLCADALRKSYLVVKTCSPFEAVAFMDAGRGMIDLVICDYTMPGMNGLEFLDKIRSLNIKTPIILYTGIIIDKSDRQKFDAFLRILVKPFSGAELREEVSKVLAPFQQEINLYKKYEGVLPHLNISSQILKRFLIAKGLVNPSATSPRAALEYFGVGESYNIFMSWHYLNELQLKISATSA